MATCAAAAVNAIRDMKQSKNWIYFDAKHSSWTVQRHGPSRVTGLHRATLHFLTLTSSQTQRNKNSQNEVQLVSTYNPKRKRKHWRATDHSGIYRIKPLHTYNR